MAFILKKKKKRIYQHQRLWLNEVRSEAGMIWWREMAGRRGGRKLIIPGEKFEGVGRENGNVQRMFYISRPVASP